MAWRSEKMSLSDNFCEIRQVAQETPYRVFQRQFLSRPGKGKSEPIKTKSNRENLVSPQPKRQKNSVVIGITGGISTGKSTFSDCLRQELHAKLFDADRAARQLVDHDPEVRDLLREAFGREIFSVDGNLNRAALRAIVFADREKKRALEHILHPRIRRQWATEAEQSRQSGEFFLADIPLLYETNSFRERYDCGQPVG